MITGFEEFTDSYDVIAAYDEVIKDLATVPLSVDYAFTKEELSAKSIDELRKLAASRKVFDQTDNKGILINSVLNSQRVPVTWATPENAWGSPEYAAGKIEQSSPAAKSKNVSYPAIAITRTGMREDANRYTGGKRRKIAWSNDGNSVLQSEQPTPIIIDYQIDAMSIKFYHANMIDLHVIRKFERGVLRTLVNLGKPWGSQKVDLFLSPEIRDASHLDAAEDIDKYIRHVYSIRLEGWIPRKTQTVRTVRKIKYEMVEVNAATKQQDSLESVVDTLPDIYAKE